MQVLRERSGGGVGARGTAAPAGAVARAAEGSARRLLRGAWRRLARGAAVAPRPTAWRAVETLEDRRLMAANVIISEFLALNDTGIIDNFNRRSDWIELHNAGTTDANLVNYRLSDNPLDNAKWNFPAVTLPAGGYLVVWASDEDERI